MLLKRNHVSITIFGGQDFQSSNINKVLKSRMGFSVPPAFPTLITTLLPKRKEKAQTSDFDKLTIRHAHLRQHSLSHVYTTAEGSFTPSDPVTVTVTFDGQNGYATHSACHSAPQTSKVLPVNVTVTESFGENQP